MRSHLSVGTTVLVMLFGLEGSAAACAVCSAGEVGMTPREAGRAAPGAFGANVDVRAGSLRLGDTSRLSEWRTEGSVHVAPTEGLRFRIAVPVLARQLVGPNLGEDRKPVAGDVSASMDAQISDTREGRIRRSLVLTVGLAFPTGPAMTDTNGAYLPSVLQPGCNSLVPETIASYRFSKGPYSLTLAPRVRLPIPVRDAPHRGATIGLGASGQWQPHPRFATRLGTNVRYELEGADAEGRGDGVSGGFVTYVSPEIALRPTLDVTWTVGIFAPVVQATAGGQRETVVFVTGLSWAI